MGFVCLKQGWDFVSVGPMDRGVLYYEFSIGLATVEIFS
jgi:hypothetical protein